jgi:cyclophilin family peptidyl-prolyl cis-trans isomerase
VLSSGPEINSLYGETMRYLLSLLLVVITCASLGCAKNAPENQTAQKEDKMESLKPLTAAEIDALIEKIKAAPLVDVEDDEVGVIETDLGRIVLEFYTDVAPQHCRAFKRLANLGGYDGTTFHRVVPEFVIQGGDLLSRDADRSNDGTGQPGYTLPAEFSALKHERGILSMARRGNDVNSGGSQFFICLAATPFLDGQYTIWGRVAEGMGVVDQVVATSGTDQQKQNPDNPVVMKKVRVMKRNEL